MENSAASPVTQGHVSRRPLSIRFADWGYQHASRADFAIRHLNLSIPAGQHVLLLGASGIGKSTLMEVLAGLLGAPNTGAEQGSSRQGQASPESRTAPEEPIEDDEGGICEGSILIDGQPISRSRGQCALVMQDPDSQMILQRVGDTVAFGLENQGVAEDQIWPRVRAAMEAVGLGQMELHRSTAHLSGGQMQRIALAGALCMNPGVLLLDEPTANIDPDGVKQVVRTVRDVAAREPMTTVLVEHRAEPWLDFIDRVVVLGRREGAGTDRSAHVVADGTPDEVFTDESLDFDALGVWVPAKYAIGRRQQADVRARFIQRRRRAAQKASGESGKVSGFKAADSQVLETAQDLSIGHAQPVASGINCAFRAGRITTIQGRNGAGKSTFALTTAGLLPQISGAVIAAPSLAGADASGAALPADPHDWDSKDLAQRISYVFQNPEHQFVTSSVEQEVTLGLRGKGEGEAEAAESARKLLARFGLEREAHANPYTLSGGEKRRLTVAAALASSPQVLLLDEPTFGQDRTTWIEIVGMMRGIADSGVAVIAITHDEDFAAIADETIYLRAHENADDCATTGERPEAAHSRPAAGGATTIEVTDQSERVEPAKPASRSKYLASLNPAIRILGAILLSIPLFFSLDPVSAGSALAMEFIVFALIGFSPWRVLRSTWPILAMAPWTFLAVMLYGKQGGAVYAAWGMIHITQHSLWLALATFLRVLAVGIPAVLFILGMDTTDLADACSQVLHLPDRFVYGGLAGTRLFGVISDDWTALGQARRSRGVGDRSKVAAFFPQAFALLVLSIRRSISLATAMEARGFGAPSRRTHARQSVMHARDWVFLALCLLLPCVCLAIAWLCGTFAFFGG